MADLTIEPAAPFRLDLTVWVLRRVPKNQTDRWDGQAYRRVHVLDGAAIQAEVRQSGAEGQLTAATRGGRLGSARARELRARLRRMLGIDVDLTPFHRIAKEDRRLAGLVEPFRGFRPPRLASVFETLLNGIACQQVSLAAGMHLLNGLCRKYGLAVGDAYAFPRPEDLAPAAGADLRAIGFSTRKAEVILGTARAIVEGRLDLEGLAALDDAAALERLLELKGIGRWTAQYVLLRGLGRLDVFPADDVGSQAKMQRWLGRKERPDYEQMYRILAPWRPYRGIIYFYLLLDHQRRLGLLENAGVAQG